MSEVQTVTPLKKSILIHYSEISLKGKNRYFFEKTLMKNIKKALGDNKIRIVFHSGRFTLPYLEQYSFEEIQRRLTKVFGIHSFSIIYEAPRDLDLLSSMIIQELKTQEFETFGVSAKRADKKFPLNSPQICTKLGEDIRTTLNKKVNLKNPDIKVQVEVLHKMCCFYLKSYPGPSGLPVGVSGRSCCLLSGGIDSPVAALKMMGRGSASFFVHFHSFPFTQASSIEKVETLAKILSMFQGPSLLYLVPFAELQQEIVALADESLRVLLYRRFMLRIAERLAKKEKAYALITGESLGQVASQTMENITAVDRAVEIPILRPLIGLSKEEIIRYARYFDTYETSIIPHDDCCTFLMPRNPMTHATPRELAEAEEVFPIEEWVEKIMGKIERKIIRPT